MATLGWQLDSFWKKKKLNWGSFWTILVYGHVQGHSLLLINVGESSLQWVIPVWQVDLVCKRKADEQVRGIMSESRVPLWSLFQFLPLVSCLVSFQDGLYIYSISSSNPHNILDFVMGLDTTAESKLDHFNNTLAIHVQRHNGSKSASLPSHGCLLVKAQSCSMMKE